MQEVAQIPKISWTVNHTNGDIVVQADRPPKAVHMWHANTCALSPRRDFRIVNWDDPCLCGLVVDKYCANLAVLWTAEELQETSPGSLTYVAHREMPSFGRWTAFFVDVQFEGPEESSSASNLTGKAWPFGQNGVFVFTTEASVLPNTFPFEDCQAEECLGDLL